MLIKMSSSALKNGEWHEYAVRFALGGAATMLTGAISTRFGPSIGGLFLALPAIFCASATLIEKHERERKAKAGLEGGRRGKQAAALDAAGAALGSFGMMAFATVFFASLTTISPQHLSRPFRPGHWSREGCGGYGSAGASSITISIDNCFGTPTRDHCHRTVSQDLPHVRNRWMRYHAKQLRPASN